MIAAVLQKGFRWRRGPAVAPYMLRQLLHGPCFSFASVSQLQLQAAMPADQMSSISSQQISQKVAGDVSISGCSSLREGSQLARDIIPWHAPLQQPELLAGITRTNADVSQIQLH